MISSSSGRSRDSVETDHWIEKRSSQRLSSFLKAAYRRLEDHETSQLRNDQDCQAALGRLGELLEAQTTDLSLGGMSLLGRDSFTHGDILLVQVDLPKIGGPFLCLGEVRWAGRYDGVDGTVFTAGLKTMYAHRYDLVRLNSYLKFWGRA